MEANRLTVAALKNINEESSMKIARVSTWNGWAVFRLLICSGWVLFLPKAALAQCNTSTAAQGFNALYGNCVNSATKQAGFAMVDATQFGTDICVAINNIYTNSYNPTNSNGIVIDARGFTASLVCSTNPWPSSFVSSAQFSSVVLLPAGTIILSKTLVMPHNTRLLGAGSGLTTLKAINGFQGDMIDMGNSVICINHNTNKTDCPGVVIEHLALDGGGQALNGIVNNYSQELSYINDVSLSNFTGGTGLWLNDHSDNSGPYTNISYSGSGICAQFFNNGTDQNNNLVQTRGIHGLTCKMSGSEITPAIYLDSPNNSLEDVYITGHSSQDGILIGSQAAAYNNVLFNVRGSGLGNVIEISNANPANVTDLTILGVTCMGGGSTCSSGGSVKDIVRNTTLTDSNVGLYIVGEQLSGGIGYSRFTTSHALSEGAVTWLVGSNPPRALTDPCAAGSLYSCTNHSNCSTTTLWGCLGVTGWKGIK
jgi:hypothetical protein